MNAPFPPPSEPRYRPTPLHVEGHRPRVLVAEDDPDVRDVFVDVLQEEGFEARGVPSGDALLADLNHSLLLEQDRDPPDIILTDLKMPGLDVVSIIGRLNETGWSVPVVVISGHIDDELRARLDGLPRVQVLDKPIDPHHLCTKVASAVGARP